MTKLTLFLATIVLLCAGGLATAGPVIDQSQTNGSSYMAAFSQGDLAQSFQQAHDNVSGAGIELWTVGTSDTVTIALWDDLPNQLGSSMLASGSAVGTAGSWVDVSWTLVAVVPDTTLYSVIASLSNDVVGYESTAGTNLAQGAGERIINHAFNLTSQMKEANTQFAGP